MPISIDACAYTDNLLYDIKMNKEPSVDELAKSVVRGTIAYAVGIMVAAQLINLTCGGNDQYQTQVTEPSSVAEQLTRQAETK